MRLDFTGALAALFLLGVVTGATSVGLVWVWQRAC
jgi:hypothetical protein